MKRDILIITSRSSRRQDAFSTLREACVEAARRVGHGVSIGNILDVRTATDSIHDGIAAADIVLADVSDSRQDVIYELGFAHGCNKPTILVSNEASQPTLSDLSEFYVHLYKESGEDTAFNERLVSEIVEAVQDPKHFAQLRRARRRTPPNPTVFVSYNQADSQFIKRLRVHLRPLQRKGAIGEGAIDYWDDTRIDAGQKWKVEIEEALARARIAVLLVSADFLASDFVMDSEVPTLLANAEKGGTTILPVILKPCRFERDDRLSAFQSINNPSRPLISLPEGEQEEIYARVAYRIENELRHGS